jgi:hypothetical protein
MMFVASASLQSILLVRILQSSEPKHAVSTQRTIVSHMICTKVLCVDTRCNELSEQVGIRSAMITEQCVECFCADTPVRLQLLPTATD